MIASLHYITQDNLSVTHSEQAKLALDGGVKWVQFRSKVLSLGEIKKELRIIKEYCIAYGAILILNDNWQLAIEMELDGVHVGLTDTPVHEIRKHTNFLIGGTANSYEDIRLHVDGGVDYVGVGPFRHTETKKNLSPVLGLSGFQEIISSCKERQIDIPIIGIGGVQLSDIQSLMSVGVSGVAIASQINQAKSPTQSAAEFITELAV